MSPRYSRRGLLVVVVVVAARLFLATISYTAVTAYAYTDIRLPVPRVVTLLPRLVTQLPTAKDNPVIHHRRCNPDLTPMQTGTRLSMALLPVPAPVGEDEPESVENGSQFRKTSEFLIRAGLVGVLTGAGVVVFKTSLAATSSLFYETLADVLPKPAFYWPLALYPVLGSLAVCGLTYLCGPAMKNGVDSIAKSIDSDSSTAIITTESPSQDRCNEPLSSPLELLATNRCADDGNTSVKHEHDFQTGFNPLPYLYRLMAATATVGSGCSLGPEGPAVEIGTSLSRMVSGTHCSLRERHRLFLCGTAAAVAAGFNAPIAGVFFAIECGNRYLAKNTVKLDEDAPDGPRADIAAIVLAASAANVVVGLGLHEKIALAIQGNAYRMNSPLFELTVYLGLGLTSGLISVVFSKLKNFFTNLFETDPTLASIQPCWRPLLGGLVCGVIAVYFPQTLFVGYATLDQLLAGKIVLGAPLLLQLLSLKLLLTTFSLGSGLVGGVFAPSLFFGATAGTAYHDVVAGVVSNVLNSLSMWHGIDAATMDGMRAFCSLASAPAYATVGAAATLGALFRAPLTSSMLMFELTQNHDIVLPVLVSTGLGGLFAELISQPREQW